MRNTGRDGGLMFGALSVVVAILTVSPASSGEQASMLYQRQGTSCGNSPEALGDILYVPGDSRQKDPYVTSIRYVHIGATPAGWLYKLNDGREVFQPAHTLSAKGARMFGVTPPSSGNGSLTAVHRRPNLSEFDVQTCTLQFR
jgi:hypothetical protein